MTSQAYPRRAGPPAAEPVTLADALTHLHEVADGGANDAYITSLISVARQACEDRTERTLISTPWLLQLDAFPTCGAIALRSAPVLAVQSVQYLDEGGVWQTLGPAAYVLDAASVPARLVPAPGAEWPRTQVDAINAVRVSYTAGYGTTAAAVPLPLRQWILCYLHELYQNRGWSAPEDFCEGLIYSFRQPGV